MKEKILKNKTIFLALGIVAFFLFIWVVFNTIHPIRYIQCSNATLTIQRSYLENGEAVIKKVEIPRGYKVRVSKKQETTSTIRYKNNTYTIQNKYLASSKKEAVHTDYVYARRLVNLHNQKDEKLSKTILKKGEKAKVVSIDLNDLDSKTGEIQWYKIEKGNKEYYVRGEYVETSKKLALKNYAKDISYSTYWDAYYKNGYSKNAYIRQVDYKPEEKETYKNNTMPKTVRAMHVSMNDFVHNAKSLQKIQGINTFVVEAKNDEGSILYQSDACKEYLSDPSMAIQNAVVSKEKLKSIVKQYQDKGFYIVSRIVTFKDAIFATENPNESLTDHKNNLVLHNNQYWPSAYSRKAWMYNVAIANECADLGFNEIQFDYVRFPDGTTTLNDTLNFHNTYNESKVSAIQGFLQYAKEELKSKQVYVAADIFAWPIVACDDQDIGQFLPAIANVVDVVCPMPYLDHFSSGAFNIDNPEDHPYKTLSNFTQIAKNQMKSIPYASKYRTWIQGYTMNAKKLKLQIKSLKDNGYPDFMIWNPENMDEIKNGLK